MTDFETIKRVNPSLQWDGFPGEKTVAKVLQFPSNSAVRIANVTKVHRSAFKGLLLTLPLGIAFWGGVWYVLHIVWVR